MRAYEIIYIVKPTTDEMFEEVNAKFKTLIESNGGVIEKFDRWGKKRLAYEMKGCNEGLYVLVAFEAESACVSEVDRVLKITDDILRHMIIRKEC